jgi:hypothetical protein
MVNEALHIRLFSDPVSLLMLLSLTFTGVFLSTHVRKKHSGFLPEEEEHPSTIAFGVVGQGESECGEGSPLETSGFGYSIGVLERLTGIRG